jgi:hypothetical protein
VGFVGGEYTDASWEPQFQWDDNDFHPTPVDINPPPVVKLGQEVEHNAQVEKMVATAKAKLAPDLDCKRAYAANQAACDAYGEHSPVCTGAQTQYVMKCGASAELYTKETNADLMPEEKLTGYDVDVSKQTSSELDEQLLLQMKEGTRTGNELVVKEQANEQAMKTAPESAEKQAFHQSMDNSTSAPIEPSLKSRVEPVLMGCNVKHLQAKMNCKKAIAEKYQEFRAGEKVQQMPEESSAVSNNDELGSTAQIDKVYNEAMTALAAVKAKKKLGLTSATIMQSSRNDPMDVSAMPSVNSFDSAEASERFAQDELFDEADPISRATDIESEALGTVPFAEFR